MMVPTSSARLTALHKKEPLASLPLQMSAHFNAYFAPFLFIAEASSLILKYPYLSVTYKVILVAVLIVYILVEIIRLSLAIVGNLGEKIPAISGFWILSLVLQLPIVLFLLLNPSIVPVPVEIVVLIIHLIFLVTQIITGFLAMKAMSTQQIKLFKMIIEESEK